MEGKTTEPRWFAHWWAEQQDRHNYVGSYADEVYAEGKIPIHSTRLEDITCGRNEYFADLIETAWFTWVDETSQSPSGWAYIENLLNQLYPEWVEHGPSHRVVPADS